MSNYTQTTAFGPKDALLSGNPAKLIKGADYDVEFAAIAAAITSKYDAANIGSAPVVFQAGGVGTPSITFTGDLTTGIYRVGAGQVGIAAAGVQAALFAATGVSSPSFVPTGAAVPANGIYLSAANTLAFASNTVNRGTINASGAWNIPAASAGVTLTVISAAGTNQLWSDGTRQASIFTTTATPNVQFGSVSNHPIGFFTNNGAAAVQLLTSGLFQAIDQASAFWDLGWRDMPLNVQTTNYTLALSDRGKMIRQNTAGTTITIPANASVAFPDGTAIVIINNTAGSVTVAITTDTLFLAGTVSTGSRTIGPNGMCTLVKAYASTQWSASGPGVS